MMNTKAPVIHCSFHDQKTLQLAFMPFVKGGGLFVRTHNSYTLGDTVTLFVSLMNENGPHTVETKVVWITPAGAQRNKPAGVGLQLLGDKAVSLLRHIEGYLGDSLIASVLTDTI